MALVQCHECKAQISSDAKKCPQCGAKQKRSVGWIAKGFGAILVIAMVKCSYDQSVRPPPPPKSPEQVKAEAEAEKVFQADVIRIKVLKASLKNPASFELVSAVRLANGTLCVEYRGTNSFNAITTESVAIVGPTERGAWNKHCAGKSGSDVSHIRHAL